MNITRSSTDTATGPADWFSGDVYIDGIGYVARRGSQPQEIRPGDVVDIDPGEEHWHGATASRFMAHVAIQEADVQGEVVTWLEHVTDEDYTAAPVQD